MIGLHPRVRLPHREVMAIVILLIVLTLNGRPNAVWHQPTTLQTPVFTQAVPYTHRYYFGGWAMHDDGTMLNLGPTPISFWQRLLPWQAARPEVAPACVSMAPPAKTAPALLERISADLPGLYGAPWVANVNGDLIAALHVTVPRNPNASPLGPTLQIYRPGENQPAFSQIVAVSVIRGSKALLYRMFANGPISCIDLTIPHGAGAGTAYLYYPFRGRMLEAEAIFTVQR